MSSSKATVFAALFALNLLLVNGLYHPFFVFKLVRSDKNLSRVIKKSEVQRPTHVVIVFVFVFAGHPVQELVDRLHNL